MAQDDRPDMVYGFGHIAASRRVADRATIALLGRRGADPDRRRRGGDRAPRPGWNGHCAGQRPSFLRPSKGFQCGCLGVTVEDWVLPAL